MTFNWPDIPFTGSEVEAFVDAYKELAEEIYNEFNVEAEKLAVLYRNPEALKIFLEYGIIYAAFIVKQRAGNSGPGTDFNLGNSPYNTSAMNTVSKRAKLIENLGCVFDDIEMLLAFEKNKENDPSLDPYDELQDVDSPWKGPISDLTRAIMGEKDYKTECQDFKQKYEATQNSEVKGDSPLWSVILGILEGLGGSLAAVWPGSGYNTFVLSTNLLRYYLEGNGGVWTENTRNNRWRKNDVRQDLEEYIRKYTGKIFPKDNKPYVNEITYSQELSNFFGINQTDKILQVQFGSNFLIASAFGTATVIVNSSGRVKRLIDDYDFFYSWEIIRSNTGIDVSGTPFNDLQITSGAKRKNNGECIPNVPVCTAIGEDNPFNYAYRYPVAGAVGPGCYDKWEDHPEPEKSGKPFAINISFE